MSTSYEPRKKSLEERRGRDVGLLYLKRYSENEQAPLFNTLEIRLVDEISLSLTAVKAKEQCDKFYEFTKGFDSSLDDFPYEKQKALKKLF